MKTIEDIEREDGLVLELLELQQNRKDGMKYVVSFNLIGTEDSTYHKTLKDAYASYYDKRERMKTIPSADQIYNALVSPVKTRRKPTKVKPVYCPMCGSECIHIEPPYVYCTDCDTTAQITIMRQ
jgi:hypothetical protein